MRLRLLLCVMILSLGASCAEEPVAPAPTAPAASAAQEANAEQDEAAKAPGSLSGAIELTNAPTEPTTAAAAQEAGREAPAAAPTPSEAPAPSAADQAQARALEALGAELAAQAAEESRLEAAARLALEHAAAVPRGASECETAYARLVAVARTMEAQMPGAIRGLPPEEMFLSTCAALPSPMRRCLSVEYAIDNADACTRAAEALPADQKARLAAMVEAAGGAAP